MTPGLWAFAGLWRLRLGEAAHRQRQQFIRTIPDDDIVQPAAMPFRQVFAQRVRRRVGIQPQPPVHRRLDRRQHLRRRRIRIFVGVKFDEPLDLRLLAVDIGVQLAHQGADQIFRTFHFVERISADFPCASSPSSSANFFTAGRDFLSAARLYSTRLVRRWN